MDGRTGKQGIYTHTEDRQRGKGSHIQKEDGQRGKVSYIPEFFFFFLGGGGQYTLYRPVYYLLS